MQNDRFYFRIVANTMQMVPGKNIKKLPKTILHHLNHHQSRCVQEVFLCKCRCAISIIHPNFCSLWPNVGLCWLYTTPYGSLVVVITNVFCLQITAARSWNWWWMANSSLHSWPSALLEPLQVGSLFS